MEKKCLKRAAIVINVQLDADAVAKASGMLRTALKGAGIEIDGIKALGLAWGFLKSLKSESGAEDDANEEAPDEDRDMRHIFHPQDYTAGGHGEAEEGKPLMALTPDGLVHVGETRRAAGCIEIPSSTTLIMSLVSIESEPQGVATYGVDGDVMKALDFAAKSKGLSGLNELPKQCRNLAEIWLWGPKGER